MLLKIYNTHTFTSMNNKTSSCLLSNSLSLSHKCAHTIVLFTCGSTQSPYTTIFDTSKSFFISKWSSLFLLFAIYLKKIVYYYFCRTSHLGILLFAFLQCWFTCFSLFFFFLFKLFSRSRSLIVFRSLFPQLPLFSFSRPLFVYLTKYLPSRTGTVHSLLHHIRRHIKSIILCGVKVRSKSDYIWEGDLHRRQRS